MGSSPPRAAMQAANEQGETNRRFADELSQLEFEKQYNTSRDSPIHLAREGFTEYCSTFTTLAVYRVYLIIH
jgi:hypothetical protein